MEWIVAYFYMGLVMVIADFVYKMIAGTIKNHRFVIYCSAYSLLFLFWLPLMIYFTFEGIRGFIRGSNHE